MSARLDALFERAIAAAEDGKTATRPPPGLLGYPMSRTYAAFIIDALRSRGDGEGQYVGGYLYTAAPQSIVERAYESAEREWKAFRKRKADKAAESANHRYSVKCRYCKAKWMEDFSHDELRQGPIFGLKHHCAKVDGVRAQVTEEIRKQVDREAKGQGDRESKFDADFKKRWMLWNIFITAPVKWKNTGAPTECGAKCMSALGPNCDCRCKGVNHGANKVIA